MEYKVSYRGDWDDNGTYYDQTINMRLSKSEFDGLNRSIAKERMDSSVKVIRSGYDMDILSYLRPLSVNRNYTTHTTRDFVLNYFNLIGKDRRILCRNTIIFINIV